MDYIAPKDTLHGAVTAGRKKALSTLPQLLASGFLAGAVLGFSAALAYKASAGMPENVSVIVGAALFPAGFAIIVLLGLDLVTGSFGLHPIALKEKAVSWRNVLRNWGWVYAANSAGAMFFGLMFAIAITEMFTGEGGATSEKIQAVAQAKTLGYEHAGIAGWFTAVIKGILCDWMVALGSILALSSRSALGKVVAVWLPIATFFGLGFEHSIVNMFVIPTSMMLGSGITVSEWLVWNQVPVTIGNVIGGACFAGFLFYWATWSKSSETTTDTYEPESAQITSQSATGSL